MSDLGSFYAYQMIFANGCMKKYRAMLHESILKSSHMTLIEIDLNDVVYWSNKVGYWHGLLLNRGYDYDQIEGFLQVQPIEEM